MPQAIISFHFFGNITVFVSKGFDQNVVVIVIKVTRETPDVRSDKRYLKDIPKICQRYPQYIL